MLLLQLPPSKNGALRGVGVGLPVDFPPPKAGVKVGLTNEGEEDTLIARVKVAGKGVRVPLRKEVRDGAGEVEGEANKGVTVGERVGRIGEEEIVKDINGEDVIRGDTVEAAAPMSLPCPAPQPPDDTEIVGEVGGVGGGEKVRVEGRVGKGVGDSERVKALEGLGEGEMEGEEEEDTE